MATDLRVPLKGMQADDLAQLNTCFMQVRDKLNLRD
jgi:hypothetical protein